VLPCARCDTCERLASELTKASQALEGVVKVVAIDATIEPALARRFDAQRYPMI
jgi:thioredoxin-like negative regulator of GroEL